MNILTRNQFFLIFLILFVTFLILKSKSSDKIPIKYDQGAQLINDLNEKNSNINSLILNGDNKKLKYHIAYKKPDQFLLSVEGQRGREIEVGFDNLYFWFYIKNFDSKNLYFCDKSKLDQTRIKPILRPEILIDLLGLNAIDPSKFIFFSKNDKIEAKEKKLGFIRIVILDVKENNIIEQSYYYENDLFLSVKIQSFFNFEGNNIPKSILINFKEERLFIPVEIKSKQINTEFKIEMPSDYNKINLVDY
jgi:hypothetical protein